MEQVKPIVIKGRSIERARVRHRLPGQTVRIQSGMAASSQPGRFQSRTASRRFRQRRQTVPEVKRSIKLIRKVIISAVLLTVILLLNVIDTPFTKGVVGYVKSALTNDYDFGDGLGQLKFVKDIAPDIIAVFGYKEVDNDKKLDFKAPVQGSVISKYNEATAFGGSLKNEGIDIKTGKNAEFYASADGQIAAIEVHEVFGKSLWISHSDGYFTFYGGCENLAVAEGQKVSQGDRIGKIAVDESGESMLHFEIWKKDKTQNPLDTIKSENKA